MTFSPTKPTVPGAYYSLARRIQHFAATLAFYAILLPPMLICWPACVALVVGGMWADLSKGKR